MADIKTISWKKDKAIMIDQTKLPQKFEYLKINNYKRMGKAIKEMNIRGAPAIGVAAAFGMALAALKTPADINKIDFIDHMTKAKEYLSKTRPTAVNLFWALDRIMELINNNKEETVENLKNMIINEAKSIAEDDYQINKKMADIGAKLVKKNDKIVTHCNAGALATSGIYGTALGVIKRAHELKKDIFVWAKETRPRCQGARLTAFELLEENIPHKVIADSMYSYICYKKEVDCVILGADRVLGTGHVINKIGTSGVAIISDYYNVPFYVIAPASTFDLKTSVEDVIIEERDHSEVKKINGKLITPEKSEVINPAFDITPPDLVTAIVSEKGIIYPPYETNIKKILNE
ncbi:MAG: S-methyl-5-thioribose-1-phosphate isomerase [Candidatus Lokiarchaeota archaeon]|nr:S-methyl-5-thioribose-1-phosphate isomerase [Candidatus Lokiarchaeota archaeon]